jgi:hypothetical protein
VIGIAPAAAHPVSKGVLCPYAFGAHQLPFHPLRITGTLCDGLPVTLDTAIAEITARVKRGRLAILDERPGRALSAAYQRIASARGGLYIAPGRSESATLEQIAAASGLNCADLGLDLENVRTLVSFGAPVLESWATPGRVLHLWKEKRLAVVLVEAELSKTAALADVWIPAAGTGAALPPDAVRYIRDRGPMLAISGGGFSSADEQAIAALNQGSTGIIRRGEPSVAATPLTEVPDGSIEVLIIDHGPLGGSVPIETLRSKLQPGGIVVSLTPYRVGAAAHAHFLIPAPAFGESLDEVGTPWDAAVPSYSVAPALTAARAGTIHPLDLLHRVTGGSGSPDSLIRARVDSLFTRQSGEIFELDGRTTKKVTEFKSAGDLWKAFSAGACWISSAAKPRPARLAYQSRQAEAARLNGTPAVVPPLFTKLYQESKLRRRRDG